MRDISELINRIHCADCLCLMRGMPDKCVDLVLTDPPYGIGDSGKNNQIYNCEWEGKAKLIKYTPFDDTKPTEACFNEMFRVSKNQIIFGVQHFTDFLPQSPAWIVWDKKKTGIIGSGLEIAWTSFDHGLVKFTYKFQGMLQGDMAHKEDRVHPTQKPLPLMMWCLEKYSKPGMTVLDPFMGSGTTCVACKKLGRNYIGIDKEPEYIKIAEKRLEKVNNHKIDEWF